MRKTRAMRRLEKRYHDTKAKKKSPFAPMDDRTEEYAEMILKNGRDPQQLKFMLVNDVLTIQIFEWPDRLRVMGFRNNNESSNLSWAVKQYWKEQLFPGHWGVEAFPPKDDLVDAANMYWVQILPGGEQPPFNFKERELWPPISYLRKG